MDVWKIDQRYSPLISRAGSDAERRRLIHDRDYELDGPLERLEYIKLARLLRVASKYPSVIVPQRVAVAHEQEDENWKRGHFYGTWSLKEHAIADVWCQIETAKKRRRELWLPIVAAITGLIGAATGLVALLKK